MCCSLGSASDRRKKKNFLPNKKKNPASPPRRPLQSPWRRRLVFQAALHLRMRGTDLTTLCESLQSGGQPTHNAAAARPSPPLDLAVALALTPLRSAARFAEQTLTRGFPRNAHTAGRTCHPSPRQVFSFLFSLTVLTFKGAPLYFFVILVKKKRRKKCNVNLGFAFK